MRASRWIVIGALLVASGVLWWWTRPDELAEPREVRALDAGASGAIARTRPAAVAEPRLGDGAPRWPLPAAHESASHVYDPCRAAVAPTIPPGFERVTQGGVTVAWHTIDLAARDPYDTVFDPIALAGTVTGILEQAASTTGTERRAEITIVVHASPEELRARVGLPAWTSGAYDGGAVHVARDGRGDLGIVMSTLRHELMHAQVHDAIGCVPAWFNEGLAMHFAGTPPIREWLAMLRHPEAFDLAALSRAAIDDEQAEPARRHYAESLALVVYLSMVAGDDAIGRAARDFHADGRWDAHFPQLDGRTVLDVLARKLFGVGLGTELDAVLGGVVCCHGLRSVSEVGCRAAGPRPAKRTGWRDTSATPTAWCAERW